MHADLLKPRVAMVAALTALMATTGPAHAERATLGTAVPTTSNTGLVCGMPCTVAQTALPNASAVTPPGEGRIDAWWAIGKGATLHVRLRLLHTAAGGQFRAVGTSSDQRPTETVTDFPTDLPAGPGDLLGATMSGDGHSDILEMTPTMGANVNVFSGDFPDGSTQSFGNQFPDRLEMGADFVFRPVVSGVAAASGSATGGDPVVITGNHLTDTTSVRFGATEAASFTIDSNTQITAISPAANPGAVDVTAAGPGGTSATGAGDRYTFVTPQGAVSPETIDFGTVPVGGVSGVQAVTVTNTGTVPVSVASAALAGGDTGEFTKLSDDCSGHRVAPGASCSVPLAFTPGTAGAHRATLRVDDSLAGSPHNVVLVGTAPGTVAPGPVVPAGGAPSNAFTIGSVRGTRVRVKVAASGTVRVTEGGVKPAAVRRKRRLLGTSSATGGPGTVSVPLRLTALARKKLKSKHRLTLRVTVRFTPAGGTAASKTATLVVKTKRRRRA